MKYIERILNNIETESIPKTRMSIRDIKDSAENLNNPEKIINRLELSLSQHKENKELFNDFIKLQITLSELKEKSILMENISSFAYYLAVMKVTTISKDFKKTKHIISKFMKSKNTHLSALITHMHTFNSKINTFESQYKTFNTLLSKDHKLEDKLDISSDKNFKDIKQLKSISIKQKELMYNIGITFSDLMKQMMKDKEFKNHIKR